MIIDLPVLSLPVIGTAITITAIIMMGRIMVHMTITTIGTVITMDQATAMRRRPSAGPSPSAPRSIWASP